MPKWYNWTEDEVWDEYCKYAWLFILGPMLLFFGFFTIWGIVDAIIKHVRIV